MLYEKASSFIAIFTLFGLAFFRVIQAWQFNKDDCHRIFPSGGGIWVDHPPYWLPNCKSNQIQVFGRASIEKCLKGRTVYVIGNSIGRGVLFELVEMLGGASVSREDQKSQCTKLSTKWEDSCHKELAGIKFKFLYILYMDGWDYSDRGGFPFVKDGITRNGSHYFNNAYEVVNPTLPDPIDNCSNQKMRDCLRNFFSNATMNDILIFSLGIMYSGFYKYDQIDGFAFAYAQAVAFRQNIKQLFPGKVFRFTGSQAYKHLTNYSSPFHDLELKSFWPAWQPRNETKAESWYTIDQWAINKDRGHLYIDYIHFPGALTRALLFQILSLQCPGMGVRSEDYPSIVGKVVKVEATNIHDQTINPFYVIDDELWLRPLPNNCLSYFVGGRKEPIKQVKWNNDLFKKGKAFPISSCNHGMYLATNRGKVVFQLLSLDGQHIITSFDREKLNATVTIVPEWVVSQFLQKSI